ncbi:MAG: dihydroorotate dehydrogenase [Candidatus Omnitrophota bacterium]|nr:dihydroorotate dehydrogenase [Candidatus Omnitrophota bacterium]
MRPNLAVKIGKLKLKNPVLVASGTFGYAEEFADFLGLKQLGAIVTKTITLSPRQGNVPPRTCETPAGMLNSIGLENPGVESFMREKLPSLVKIGVPLIVSIASEKDPDEFRALAKRLDKVREVAAIELNISCPNIKLAGERVNGLAGSTRTLISQDPDSTYEVVKAVRKVTSKTLITKLSPNVTDIGEIAQAAERAGADAIALINTITAMSIDVEARRSKLAMVTGGLSGPAIRPIALRMAWEASRKIKIPIIGMGGIMDTSSALEFFLAGASAIALGTVNFVNPRAAIQILGGIKEYLTRNKIEDIKDLIGSLKV